MQGETKRGYIENNVGDLKGRLKSSKDWTAGNKGQKGKILGQGIFLADNRCREKIDSYERK